MSNQTMDQILQTGIEEAIHQIRHNDFTTAVRAMIRATRLAERIAP